MAVSLEFPSSHGTTATSEASSSTAPEPPATAISDGEIIMNCPRTEPINDDIEGADSQCGSEGDNYADDLLLTQMLLATADGADEGRGSPHQGESPEKTIPLAGGEIGYSKRGTSELREIGKEDEVTISNSRKKQKLESGADMETIFNAKEVHHEVWKDWRREIRQQYTRDVEASGTVKEEEGCSSSTERDNASTSTATSRAEHDAESSFHLAWAFNPNARVPTFCTIPPIPDYWEDP
ncbi:hypothetical protein HDV00_009940 [Rhizophlyctis rosea]|nr:hypothetical protein HDV00_009940 [Rhizophlyctis rosea]